MMQPLCIKRRAFGDEDYLAIRNEGIDIVRNEGGLIGANTVDRVSEIAGYIAQDNPVAADRWVDTVFEKVRELKGFPESGRIVPEINNKTIRELIYGNYRIVYRVEISRSSILTVRHGKQLLPVDEIKA